MINVSKKIFLLLVIFLLTSQVYALVDNYDTSSYLDIEYSMDSSLDISYTSDPQLEYLIVNLSLVPKDDKAQIVTNLQPTSNPQSIITSDKENIIYRWDFISDNYIFGLDSQIRTLNYVHPVQHVDFPILDVPPEAQKYLSPTENINLNQAIIDQATELSAGQTDLFETVFKIADWTKTNINYDLNTLTASAVQKSTWVLENREGVCDEMTSLFISMLRSIGIPARFVTGMVYTNTLYDFGNHGWAEVYFPGYGWVPFDVTFGEYGYIDPGHVKLSDSTDSASPSVKYSWKEYHVSVKPNELDLKSRLIEHGPAIAPRYRLEIEPLANNFGPSSYFPLKVTVTNPTDSYISTTLTLTKAPKLTTPNNKQIFLRPKETQYFYWISYISQNIESGYIYTSQIEVQDSFGSIDTTKIFYSNEYTTITNQKAQEMISDLSQEPKIYSKEIELYCNLSKPYYYNYETAKIDCLIQNKANKIIDNLQICLIDNCQNLDLGLGDKRDIQLDLPLENFSPRQLVVNAKNAFISANYFLTLNVFTKPDIIIEDKLYPSSVDYNQDFKFSFAASSKTKINKIIIKTDNQIFELGDLYGDKNYTIMLNSRSFTQNIIPIKIEFEDENNNTYKYEEKLKIEVNNVPYYIQLWNFIKSFF